MPKPVDCAELKKIQSQILDCRKRYVEAVDRFANTGNTGLKIEIETLRWEYRQHMDHVRELLGFSKLERLRAEEARKLSIFFEKTIVVPPLPAEITPNRLTKWEQMGFELHYLPAEDMGKDRVLSGWTKKPNNWFYRLAALEPSPVSTRLSEGWFIVDGRQKPAFTDGSQMYDNDPLAPALADLNQRGIISQTASDGSTKLDPQSRFGLSPDDFDKPEVVETLAKALDLKPDQLSLSRVIVWNVLANIHHPEWGTTHTAEWLKEEHISSNRLVCGDFDGGGVSHLHWVNGPSDRVGFRPLGRFSP